MEGEKYLSNRIARMTRSKAGMFAGLKFRLFILLIVIGSGWLFCDVSLRLLKI